MKIFGKEIELPQLIVQSDVCQDVGLVPVIGVLPTLGDHGLGREVNDIGSLKLPDLYGSRQGEFSMDRLIPSVSYP